MTLRSFASTGIVAILATMVSPIPGLVTAQAPTSARTAAKADKAPRTADGQPDLQGFWSNTTYTPLQRPNNVTKEFYTKEEAEELVKRAAAAEGEQTEPGTIPDVHYDFTQFGLDRSQSHFAVNLRTSLIVDPPDGRLPPLSAEGQRRAAERAEARKKMGGPYDAAENQSPAVRCILMDRIGPPMLAGAYNNNYQILQTPGYVMILVEMLHDVRIIPLDGRPHLAGNVRQWTGSYRGRWEGDTLVIETRNLNGKMAFQGSSENMRLVERFTRVDEDTMLYRFTVDDPSTWTRPWSAEVIWRKTIGPLFEHACHEANYGLANILAGARAEEKRAAGQ
jgi:cell division septation protein DedD